MVHVHRQSPNLTKRLLVAFISILGARAAAGEVNLWSKNSLVLPSGVICDPATPGTLYARSDQEMVRSEDNGATWAPFGISAVPLAVGPPGTVYAADGQFDSGLHVISVHKTSDGGSHWSTILEQFSPAPLFAPRIVIDPTNPTTLYRVDFRRVGTFLYLSTLFRSSDGGLAWTPLGGWPYSQIDALAVDPQTAGTLYVALSFTGWPPGVPASPPVVYKSTDAGDTWTELATAPVPVSEIAIDPLVPTTIYVTGTAGVFRSTDAGTTFALQSTSLPPDLSSLAVDPVYANRLYASASGYGVFASADSGVTWTPINGGLDSLLVNSLVVDASGGFLHASTANGLFDYQVVSAPTVLSLNPGRSFSVTLSASNPATGETAAGLAMPASSIFGYFSLPALTGDPANPEVFVKILDGTGVNGHYWVFYGGLTSLPYDLTVTDDVTGRTRTYTKPAESACGGFDTASFSPE